jgi:hypothetical protein
MTTKKTATKKTATKKTATKKTATKKTATKKATAKKATAKKTATKKATATKATAKKATAKKPASRPAPSTKPLAMKLGILSGRWVIAEPPAGFELLLPPDVELALEFPARLAGGDAVLAFVLDSGQVGQLASILKRCLPKTGEARLWVAYPKGDSGRDTDLSRDRGWEKLRALGLAAVAQVAVDATWSALRFRPRA